jgi:GT2 family glycosyltransferase
VTLPPDPRLALEVLEGVAAQAGGPEHEVVVVDDGAATLAGLLGRLEGDVEIVRARQRVGPARATALGVERARGEVLVLLDGRARPATGWLAPLVAALDDPAVAVAASVTAGREDGHPAEAAAVAVRRSDVDACGGIPPATLPLGHAPLAVSLAARGHVRNVAESVVATVDRPIGSRAPYGAAAELSIVIPTLDGASERVRRCVQAIQLCTEAPHEVIVIDNGAPPQGFTAPVNAGLRAARGDYLVVMNDDVEVLPGWWEALRGTLDAGAAVVYPATQDGWENPGFSAWCFAFTRTTLERHECRPGEFLDPDLVVHFQDTDLSLRLARAGTPPVRVDAARVRHGLSTTLRSEDPGLQAWVASRVAADEAAFDARHPGLLAGARRVVVPA